jgi:hypothetical protein
MLHILNTFKRKSSRGSSSLFSHFYYCCIIYEIFFLISLSKLKNNIKHHKKTLILLPVQKNRCDLNTYCCILWSNNNNTSECCGYFLGTLITIWKKSVNNYFFPQTCEISMYCLFVFLYRFVVVSLSFFIHFKYILSPVSY